MDLFLIILIVLLTGCTVWVWRLVKAEMTGLAVEASIVVKQQVTSSPVAMQHAVKIRFRNIAKWVSRQFKRLIWVICWKEMRYRLAWWFLRSSIPGRLARSVPIAGGIADYSGEAILPKKVYVGDSLTISIDLQRILVPMGRSFKVEDTKTGKSITFQIFEDANLDTFLEIQLLAAGVSVAGGERQCQSLFPGPLRYRWNCHFPNSGNQILTFILRVVHGSDSVEIGVIHHSMKVVKLYNLTKRCVDILRWSGSTVVAIAAIAEVLHSLGLW